MKHIKIYENIRSRRIEKRKNMPSPMDNIKYILIGYPNDNEEIKISQKEYDLINICTRFIIQWKIGRNNRWTYRDEEKEDLKDWLNVYRLTGDTDHMASDLKKYNL